MKKRSKKGEDNICEKMIRVRKKGRKRIGDSSSKRENDREVRERKRRVEIIR